MPSHVFRVLILGLFIFSVKPALAQVENRSMEAVRIDSKIKIDGELDEEAWKLAKPFDGNFVQMSPDNGAEAAYRTKVSLLYSNFAIYISAILYDPDPATIPQELSVRDRDEGKNVDIFGVILDTYNKGQNGFAYSVTAAGVQGDAAISKDRFDENWDGVWKSDVKITDEGWQVEIEIPYSALRFAKQANPTWGLNFYRMSKRLNEESTWNFVNAEVDGFLIQSGKLTGLNDIKPPLRLSFFPYITVAGSHDSGTNTFGKTLAGGMDVKLGVSESFTLDVSLIPDFSQVQSDNLVLNLSPFEVRFDENRPFFTEGFEMFNKGRIFYTRRVGQSFGSIDDEELGPDEELTGMPTSANLINATKLSGRTKAGTGVGFFNAMTRATESVIRNVETGEERRMEVDPFTNFNVLVLDQNLKNNSSVGLINTNIVRRGDARDANVTLADFRLRDKTNTYSISGSGGVSQVYTTDDTGLNTKMGFKTNVNLGKVSGKLQYGAGLNVESDTWDIRDMGYQRANNELRVRGDIGYNKFTPFSVFNNANVRLSVEHEQLYRPRTFTRFNMSLRSNFQLRTFHRFGIGINVRPTDGYNYWEPREEGRFFKYGPNGNLFLYGGTDNRKPFRIGGHTGFWTRPSDSAREFFGGIGPEYRVNNKLSLSYDINFMIGENNKGYVNKTYDANDELEDIIFGNRDQHTFTNTVGVSYIFNRNMGLTFRLRHYWTWVAYDQFYALQENGDLKPDNEYDGFLPNGVSRHNTSFNALNIDMVYTWQIAPGSFVTAVWKDAVAGLVEGMPIERNFFSNFAGSVRESHYNTLSIKLIYFVDINYFRKKSFD